MTPCLPFSSVLLHAVAFSTPQAEDEWSSLPLGTQKTMALFCLHVRIVTGLSLDVSVLKLIPRKRGEMDYMVTNPFNLELLISLLWSSDFLPTTSVATAHLSTQQFQSHWPVHFLVTCWFICSASFCHTSIHLPPSSLSSSIYPYSIHLPPYSIPPSILHHPSFIHTLIHTMSISPSTYHPSALHFYLLIYHPPYPPFTMHLSSILPYLSSIWHPSIYPLINPLSTCPSFVFNLSITYPPSILYLPFTHHSSSTHCSFSIYPPSIHHFHPSIHPFIICDPSILYSSFIHHPSV